MNYTNSSLIDYTLLSKNNSGQRNHIIDTITIHCFVGQVTVERGCQVFSTKQRKASCNYVVAKDGKIGLVVEEKNRSWCSSSVSNDNRAITIEVASDNYHPYKITDKALQALITLCADICLRNNIHKLVWSTNKIERVTHLNGVNMTVHRDFANKSCPGDYIYDKMFYIADEVNKMLNNEYISNTSEKNEKTEEKETNRSQFKVKVNVDVLNIRSGVGTSCKIVGQIKDKGVYTIVEKQGSWGKLKSGAGWISLSYTNKVN